MGLFSNILNSLSRDYSDDLTCPICNAKCYWDEDEETWFCESCGYEVEGEEIVFDNNGKAKVEDIDWYCDKCNTYLNIQTNFDLYADSWTCTNCGYENSLTKDNVF